MEAHNLIYLHKVTLDDRINLADWITYKEGKKAKYFWQDDIEEGFYSVIGNAKININSLNKYYIVKDNKVFYKPSVTLYVANEEIKKEFDTIEDAKKYYEEMRKKMEYYIEV